MASAMEINETITVVKLYEDRPLSMLSDEGRQAQWPVRSSCKVFGLKGIEK